MAVHYLYKKTTGDTELVRTNEQTVIFTEVRLGDSGYYVGFRAPTLAGNQTYEWPVSDGSNNQVLTTDSSGRLSWSNKGGGGGVTEAFKTIIPVSGTIIVADLAADTLTFFVGSNKMTIAGNAANDSLTFDVVEGNIVHNNLSGYVAARHIDWKAASDNLVTSGSISSTGTGGLITGNNSNLGKVVIYDGSNHTVTLTVPSIAASYTLKFPTTSGTPDQLMKTDGSGNLGWVTSVATDMLVKVGAGGTADYLNSSYFERDAGNHIRIKQNSLLTGVSAQYWAGQTLPADPGADRILFWDDGAPNLLKWLAVSTGLTLSGTNLTTNDGQIVHNSLSGYSANRHLDHTIISINSGGILSGGGTIAANRTISLASGDVVHNSTSGYVANRHIDWTNASNNLLTSGIISVNKNASAGHLMYARNRGGYAGITAEGSGEWGSYSGITLQKEGADNSWSWLHRTSPANQLRLQYIDAGGTPHYWAVVEPADGKFGIATISPSNIFSVNQGSGNAIADDWDTYSTERIKEDIEEFDEDLIDKFKQLKLYKYRKAPHVSASELRNAAIKKFGKERWKSIFGGMIKDNILIEDDYRGGKLRDCPDEEMKTFLDSKGNELRAKRRKEDKWKKQFYGPIADDKSLIDNFPDIISRDDNGKIQGISLGAYVGVLHATILSLIQKTGN